MDEYIKLNRDQWDELTEIHVGTEFYDVAGFKAGGSRLQKHEIEELGDVSGKELLHVMCAFGLDTLSWARRGARVTGIDFSEKAVEFANSLASELALDARFIASDVYEMPTNLEGQFDIVYTSRGVLQWLPDLPRWARIMADFVRPGGLFYITEIHPIAQVFFDKEGTNELQIGYPYFTHRQPMRFISPGTYADPDADIKHVVSFLWSHDLGHVLTSLASAGLRIEWLHEFPYTHHQKPFLVRREEGWWLPPEAEGELPLSFSIGARKLSDADA